MQYLIILNVNMVKYTKKAKTELHPSIQYGWILIYSIVQHL